MTTFTLQIEVNAPAGRCFDLARSMEFHTHSMRHTGERIVGGRNAGLIGLNEEVEFQGRHLGLTRRHRSIISAFDAPSSFVDEQLRGSFKSFRHTHTFEPLPGDTTRMTDKVDFTVGWGFAGELVGRFIVGPHLRRLLTNHQHNLKAVAESDEWKTYLA